MMTSPPPPSSWRAACACAPPAGAGGAADDAAAAACGARRAAAAARLAWHAAQAVRAAANVSAGARRARSLSRFLIVSPPPPHQLSPAGEPVEPRARAAARRAVRTDRHRRCASTPDRDGRPQSPGPLLRRRGPPRGGPRVGIRRADVVGPVGGVGEGWWNARRRSPTATACPLEEARGGAAQRARGLQSSRVCVINKRAGGKGRGVRARARRVSSQRRVWARGSSIIMSSFEPCASTCRVLLPELAGAARGRRSLARRRARRLVVGDGAAGARRALARGRVDEHLAVAAVDDHVDTPGGDGAGGEAGAAAAAAPASAPRRGARGSSRARRRRPRARRRA